MRASSVVGESDPSLSPSESLLERQRLSLLEGAEPYLKFDEGRQPHVRVLSEDLEYTHFPDKAWAITHAWQWSFSCNVQTFEEKSVLTAAAAAASAVPTVDASWCLTAALLAKDIWHLVFDKLALDTLSRLRATSQWLRSRVDAYLVPHIEFQDRLLRFEEADAKPERSTVKPPSPEITRIDADGRVHVTMQKVLLRESPEMVRLYGMQAPVDANRNRKYTRGAVPEGRVVQLYFFMRSMSSLCQRLFLAFQDVMSARSVLFYLRTPLLHALGDYNAEFSKAKAAHEKLNAYASQLRNVNFKELEQRVASALAKNTATLELASLLSGLVPQAFSQVRSLSINGPFSGRRRWDDDVPRAELMARDLPRMVQDVRENLKVEERQRPLAAALLPRTYDGWFRQMQGFYSTYTDAMRYLQKHQVLKSLAEAKETLKLLELEASRFRMYRIAAAAYADQLSALLESAVDMVTREEEFLKSANKTLRSASYYADRFQELANCVWPPELHLLRSRIESLVEQVRKIEQEMQQAASEPESGKRFKMPKEEKSADAGRRIEAEKAFALVFLPSFDEFDRFFHKPDLAEATAEPMMLD